MPTKKQVSKIQRKKNSIRKSVWPDIDQKPLWRRDEHDGWLTVPRAMPLVLRIMDNLAPKGKPVSNTYFDMWCRTYDDSFVIVSNPREMAFYAGFTGERAETTWTSRVRILEELAFIEVKGGVMPINYVLLLNPYLAIQQHYKQGNVSDALFNALQQRLVEIGEDALDMSDNESE